MTEFKMTAKPRLLLGAAVNHIKLAATAKELPEYLAEVRQAFNALENATDQFRHLKEPLGRRGIDTDAIAHAESLRVGGRFERGVPEAQPWAIEAGLTTDEIQAAVAGEAPTLKPTGKK